MRSQVTETTPSGRRVALVLLMASLFFPETGVRADPNQPCRVGVQMHLSSAGVASENFLRHIRAFVERDMANYAFIVSGLDDKNLDRAIATLAQKQVPFLLQELFPHPPGIVPYPYPAARYDRDDYERFRAIAGDLFLGVHWGEVDSSGLKPEYYLPQEILERPTRRKVKEAFVSYLRKCLDDFRREFGVPFAHSCAGLTHSLFAEAGTDIPCSEIGENIPNVNMMVASNRGAARAYDRPWAIDFSTWWAPRGNAGSGVSPREGHTPWCLFTSLLGAAMGGADYVQLEVDWAAYDKDYRLLPWGRAMKTLYEVVKKMGPKGDVQTPFAILLGHENGWPGVGWRSGDVRNAGLFDGVRHTFMQTRDADLSLKIFDIFYPGFERCGWDPEYPGFLAESPFGSLDIVADNLPVVKYEPYKVLVALGYHRMTDDIFKTLSEYVQGGGILLCNDSLFLDEFEKPVDPESLEPLLGCVFDTDDANLVCLNQPISRVQDIAGCVDAATRVEWQDHCLHPVQLTTAQVVARMGDRPYILENRLGEGRVFFLTALNGVGSSETRRGPEPYLYANILYHLLHSLEDHLGDGIEFSPWTSLEHVFCEKPDGSGMLLVMNHGDMECRRDAVMKNPRGFTQGKALARGTWEAWSEGDEIRFSETDDPLKWSFEMPPKSFALFEFRSSTDR